MTFVLPGITVPKAQNVQGPVPSGTTVNMPGCQRLPLNVLQAFTVTIAPLYPISSNAHPDITVHKVPVFLMLALLEHSPIHTAMLRKRTAVTAREANTAQVRVLTSLLMIVLLLTTVQEGRIQPRPGGWSVQRVTFVRKVVLLQDVAQVVIIRMRDRPVVVRCVRQVITVILL